MKVPENMINEQNFGRTDMMRIITLMMIKLMDFDKYNDDAKTGKWYKFNCLFANA